jgi:DNA-binding transcriptional LysR family regulator
VRHGHPLAGARSFAELAGCDWAITNDDPTYVANIARHFTTLGLPAPHIRLRCESFFTLLQLMPRTDLVVAISHTLLRHPVTAEHLVPIDVTDSCPTANFAIVRKADVPLTPHANTLANCISKAAADIRRQNLAPAARREVRTDIRKVLRKGVQGHPYTPLTNQGRARVRGAR